MALEMDAMTGGRISMAGGLQGETSSYLRWSKVRAEPDKIRAPVVSREVFIVWLGDEVTQQSYREHKIWFARVFGKNKAPSTIR